MCFRGWALVPHASGLMKDHPLQQISNRGSLDLTAPVPGCGGRGGSLMVVAVKEGEKLRRHISRDVKWVVVKSMYMLVAVATQTQNQHDYASRLISVASKMEYGMDGSVKVGTPTNTCIRAGACISSAVARHGQYETRRERTVLVSAAVGGIFERRSDLHCDEKEPRSVSSVALGFQKHSPSDSRCE